jgi:hypothetical protein
MSAPTQRPLSDAPGPFAGPILSACNGSRADLARIPRRGGQASDAVGVAERLYRPDSRNATQRGEAWSAVRVFEVHSGALRRSDFDAASVPSSKCRENMDEVEWEIVRADIAMEKARLEANGDWAKWRESQAPTNLRLTALGAPADWTGRAAQRATWTPRRRGWPWDHREGR